MRALVATLLTLCSGCMYHPGEKQAKELAERCMRLGGVPQIQRFDSGPYMGEVYDVLCRGLNESEVAK